MVYSLRLDIGMPAILVFICIELLTSVFFLPALQADHHHPVSHYRAGAGCFAGHDKIGIWKW